MSEKIYGILGKLFLLISVLTLIVALLERFLNFFNLTFSWLYIRPGRLLEFSAMFLIFVIVFVLLEVKEDLRKLVQKK
jgi:hypothetical protein